MKRVFRSLPDGSMNPEWDVINTWQTMYCMGRNPQCHYDMYNDAPGAYDLIRNLDYIEAILKFLVEYNPYIEDK